MASQPIGFSTAQQGRSEINSNQQTNRRRRSADIVTLSHQGLSESAGQYSTTKLTRSCSWTLHHQCQCGFNTTQACTHLGFQPSKALIRDTYCSMAEWHQSALVNQAWQNDISQHESTKHGRMTSVSISQPSSRMECGYHLRQPLLA